MAHFKERLTPPIPSDHDITQRDHLIEFFHPAYPISAPPLLSLVAVDVAGNGTLGIDYDFAKACCGIVANNRWDDATYIATKNQVGSSLNRVSRPEDGLLPILASDMAYYFVVDHPTNRYPVVPSFDHWRFPHTELPAPWDALRIPDGSGQVFGSESKIAVRVRDRSCRVTGSIEALETAHIIPYAHHEWFESNNMRQYCRLPATVPPIDDDANLITLRADIHILWDQYRFAFVPKREGAIGSGSRPPVLVVHAVLPKGSREIYQFYHNRPLQSPVVGIAVQFLFARFALSILRDDTYRFFSGGPLQYTVCLYDKETGGQRSDNLDRDELRRCSQLFFSSSGRMKSVSPRKRKTPSTTGRAAVVDEDGSDEEWSDEGASEEDASYEDRSYRDDWENAHLRGRKRYRSADYYRHQKQRDNHSPVGLSFASTISVTPPLSPKPLPADTQQGHGWALDEDKVENKDEDDSLILLQSTKRQKII